jgi:hypothetical protein
MSTLTVRAAAQSWLSQRQLVAHVPETHLCARSHEAPGDSETDALGTSGDDGNLPVEIERFTC